MIPTRWLRAAAVASKQYGVISYGQLIDAGFTAKNIEKAVTGGHLIRLHRGVFALGHQPTDIRGFRVAGTLAVGESSCISHRTCGEHHRLLRLRRGDTHVTVPTRAGRVHRRGIRVHRAKLGPDELEVFERVRCTTVSRTLLDLSLEHPREIEKAIKSAGDRGTLSVSGCLVLLDRYPRRPGGPLLRRLLLGEEPVPEFTRSGLERRMHRLCRSAGLPLPAMNIDIEGATDIHECDCSWPRHRLIIECDSRWHDNPIASVEDAMKDQDLTLAGRRVHRLRWAQIVLEPELAARTVRHLLEEQARLTGVSG